MLDGGGRWTVVGGYEAKGSFGSALFIATDATGSAKLLRSDMASR